MRGEVGRRGQITLFFIIGLVLLFTVALLYLFIKPSEQSHVDTTSNTVNSYISTCIDTLVENKLRTLGETAGAADDPNYNPIMINGKKTIYGITRNMNAGSGLKPVALAAPAYPAPGLSLRNTALVFDGDAWVPMLPFQDGYFGDVRLPAICRKGECRHFIGVPEVTGIGQPQVSTEEYLEQYLNRDIGSCMNAIAFERSTGAQVDAVEPTVNVQFTQHAVLVHIKYKITINGKQTTQSFEPRYSVRYMPLAQFAVDVARLETQNISFDPVRDYKSVPSYLPGFTVSASRVPQGTLLTMTDEQSRIAGEWFEYRFLIEKRPPMLDAISSRSQCVDGAAIDPDGDEVTVTWNEDSKNCTATSEDSSDWQVVAPPES